MLTVTDWEHEGLSNPHNLADGHPHFRVDAGVVRSLAPRLAGMFFEVGAAQRGCEQEFAGRFYRLAGQTPPPDAELAFHYAASMSVDCAARALVANGVRSTGLITPTVDVVPLLLRRAGLRLIPLDERRFWAEPAYRAQRLSRCDALFLVAPNNPTGFEPDPPLLLEVAGAAAERGRPLVVDFSMRFYSRLHEWDQYRSITQDLPGLDAIFLEDTGKTWPAAQLKVGFACALGRLREPLRTVTRELLLNVSPFTLRLLAELIAMDLAVGPRGQGDPAPAPTPAACRLVADNRRELRSLLDGLPLQVESHDARASVEWLRLPRPDSAEACAWLEREGVSILPGTLFHWDRRGGDRHVRVALARTPATFKDAATRLAELLRRRFA